MDGHNQWIKRSFDGGIFLMVGSLTTGGGSVIAHGESLKAIEKRVNADSFVVEM